MTEFPDVLALEAGKALAVLQKAGYECSIIVTEPPKVQDKPQAGKATDYVVRQRKLDNNKAEITLVRRYRKGGVHNGTEN